MRGPDRGRGRCELRAATEQMGQLKAEARAWAAHTKSAARASVQRLVGEVEEVKREWSHVASSCVGLQSQVVQLEEGRREMLAQLLQMVSRTELSDALAELAREREAKAGLKELLSRSQRESEALAAAAQVRACETWHPVGSIQVGACGDVMRC